MNSPKTKVADLDELQHWMCAAIRTPMSHLAGVKPEPVHYLTHGEHLTADQRLEIYADDYWSRCIRSLAEDFPGLEHGWGHTKFHAVAESYLIRHPSRSYTLRNLGDRLGDFIQAEYQEADKAWALNMIRYAWARIEAFDNPARPLFDPKLLDAKTSQRLDRLSFRFQPHLTLLALDYPVQAWAKLKSKEIPVRQATHLVVYRFDNSVHVREIEKAFYGLLERMQSGLSLAAAAETLVSQKRNAEIKSLEKNAKDWFCLCVNNGWLCMPGRKS